MIKIWSIIRWKFMQLLKRMPSGRMTNPPTRTAGSKKKLCACCAGRRVSSTWRPATDYHGEPREVTKAQNLVLPWGNLLIQVNLNFSFRVSRGVGRDLEVQGLSSAKSNRSSLPINWVPKGLYPPCELQWKSIHASGHCEETPPVLDLERDRRGKPTLKRHNPEVSFAG